MRKNYDYYSFLFNLQVKHFTVSKIDPKKAPSSKNNHFMNLQPQIIMVTT